MVVSPGAGATTPGPADPGLNQPVGALLRPVTTAHAEDSLQRAATMLREQAVEMLPVAEGGVIAGAITQSDLTVALASGRSMHDPVRSAMRKPPYTIRPYATGAEALRMLHTSGEGTLVVTDDDGVVLGTVSAGDLIQPEGRGLRPRAVGGMATPFGVYLTNGCAQGGVGSFALLCTGFMLFTLFAAANAAAVWVAMKSMAYSPLAMHAGEIASILALALFLLGMHALPLAGTHAAEHMVVHAIERGEELRPEIVARMPRVHPRCGTNLATAAMLFLGTFSANFGWEPEIKLLVAAIVTLVFWRPLGSALQYYVTTKPPTPQQIEAGIRAGRELLAKHQRARRTVASPFERIWNSGLLHIMLGSAIVATILDLTARLLDIPRVYF